MSVGHDNAGVDCESLASHDPFFHTARHDALEQLTQEIALTKPAVAVLGEGRMIGNVAVEPQSTEPPVSKIEVDLLAQSPLGANAEAVADDQHTHHQFGIDRRTTRLAVIRLEMPPDLRKVHKTIDLAKQVTVRDVPLKAEAVKQRLLHYAPLAHHRPNLLLQREQNQRPALRSSRVFQRNSSIPGVPARPFGGREPAQSGRRYRRGDWMLTLVRRLGLITRRGYAPRPSWGLRFSAARASASRS
jgi:hypothetical protein